MVRGVARMSFASHRTQLCQLPCGPVRFTGSLALTQKIPNPSVGSSARSKILLMGIGYSSWFPINSWHGLHSLSRVIFPTWLLANSSTRGPLTSQEFDGVSSDSSLSRHSPLPGLLVRWSGTPPAQAWGPMRKKLTLVRNP